MHVSLQSVTASQKNVLKRYFQFYLYDYAQFNGSLPADGVFEYPWLDDYFIEEGRSPFFIMVDNDIAGFVLVRELGENHYQMSEFFVMNTFRSKGVGKKASLQVFEKFQGTWDVGQEASNQGVVTFWRKVISCVCQNYEEKEFLDAEGEKRYEQTFCVGRV